MTFSGVNYLAVIVAGIAGWVVGAAWYMGLAKHWIDGRCGCPPRVRHIAVVPGPGPAQPHPARGA